MAHPAPDPVPLEIGSGCWPAVSSCCQAARLYSSIRPFSTGFRRTRWTSRSTAVTPGTSRSQPGTPLGGALMRPGRVVVDLVLDQDGAQMRLTDDQHAVEELPAQVHREDPGRLSVQELPSGRACAARRRADTRSPQDLIDGGRRDCEAELGQLAVDPAVAPQRILVRQADD